MPETRRTVFALILLTYLCVDFKELNLALWAIALVRSIRKILLLSDLDLQSMLKMVGVTGFEPVTLRLSSACSNQLSYRPIIRSRFAQVGGAEETRTPDL